MHLYPHERESSMEVNQFPRDPVAEIVFGELLLGGS